MDQDKSTQFTQDEPIGESSDCMDVVSIGKVMAQTFSIELQTCRSTDKGIDLQVVKIDHVLSYLCICPQCGRGFPNKTSLKSHITDVHEDTCYHDDRSQSTASETGTLTTTRVKIDTDAFEPVEINSASRMASSFPSVSMEPTTRSKKKSARILARQIAMAIKGENKPEDAASNPIRSMAINVKSKYKRSTRCNSANSKGKCGRPEDKVRKPINTAAVPSDDPDGNFDDFALDRQISSPDGIDNSSETSPSMKSARIIARQINIAIKSEDKAEGVASKLFQCKAKHGQSKRKRVTPSNSTNSKGRHSKVKGNIRKPTGTAAASSADVDGNSDDIPLYPQMSDGTDNSPDMHEYEGATVAVCDKDSEDVLVETLQNCNAGKKMSKISATINAKQQPMKIIECNICGETFRADNKRQFLDHQNIHTGHTPYVCLVCEAAFAGKSQLLDHYKMHKTDGRFTCEVCGRGCQSASALGDHMNIHTGAKSHQCPICGKLYRRRAMVDVHMRSHTGERPYVCTDCGRAFTTKTMLNTHMAIHREAGMLCPHCGKSFKQRGTLNMHVRVQHGNKPVTCNICGKAFKEKTYLKLHKRSHNSEISCPVCGKSFSRRYKMLNHVRKLHPGETPFKCTCCGLAFGTPDALKAHLDETGEHGEEEIHRDQSEEVETCISSHFVDGSGNDANWNSSVIILIDGVDELTQSVRIVGDITDT